MELYNAWMSRRGELVSQVQGDCGLFSFWYASVLLREISPLGRREIFPRKHQEPGVPWAHGAVGQSVRHYAKHVVHSGQGEVMTSAEMQQIIRHFGYDCTASAAAGTSIRKTFITMALKANRPVMFPYTKGNGPVDARHALGVAGDDYGSHWSLIIHEDGNDYIYLDPHDPTIPQRFNKDTVLNSNSNVDHQKYVRYWGKPHNYMAGGETLESYGAAAPLVNHFKSTYDIAQGGRDQVLKGVLIAIH